MLKPNERRWGWVVALGLAIVHCGGKSTTTIEPDDPTTSGGSAAPAAGNGGATSAAECDDAGLVEGGCGGEAGDDPVQSYAALRNGCQQNTIVNRGGKPVAICSRIR
jgi:hypothetical protein